MKEGEDRKEKKRNTGTNIVIYILLAVVFVFIAVFVRFLASLDTDLYATHFHTYDEHHREDQCSMILHIVWGAPFLSGGGYGRDATTMLEALTETQNYPHDLLTTFNHGDEINMEYFKGIPDYLTELFFDISKNSFPSFKEMSISICQSEPGAWSPPMFQTSQCPLNIYQDEASSFLVGRTLFETDRLPSGWVERMKKMDEIWVPSNYQKDIFLEAGVPSEKLVVIPEAIDTGFFSKENVNPEFNFRDHTLFGDEDFKDSSFKFLSIFKWETRKGWDILLKAYMEEFYLTENIQLIIITKPYGSYSTFSRQVEFIKKIANDLSIEKSRDALPKIHVMKHIPLVDMPSLYSNIDCLVQPSRGEGWGLPHAEAMAMAKPVIATNWSGNLAFMTEENSILLPIEGLEEIKEGPYKGHLWAKPSSTELRRIMRDVYENIDEVTKSKGTVARADIVEKFSLEPVGEILFDHIYSIPAKLDVKMKGEAS